MGANGVQRVLVVDDEPANIALLSAIVSSEEGIEITSTTDSREAVERVVAQRPDLIMLDLMMPNLDGFEVMDLLREIVPKEEFLPILVLTADKSPDTMRRALSMGATDFLTKPLDGPEVRLRMRNLLRTRRLHCELQRYNATLETRVSERTEQLERAKLEILERLARTTEYRDDTTGRHTQRVGLNAARVWSALGLDAQGSATILNAAPLHDIGKVGIPDAILLKQGPLTAEEFERIKAHPTIGAGILSGSDFPVLQMGERIARWHHERWDGLGYPDGLAGAAIPIEARIVLVCDVFDALTQKRPYKDAWPVEKALAEIESMSGTHADPEVVRVFGALAAQGRIEIGI